LEISSRSTSPEPHGSFKPWQLLFPRDDKRKATINLEDLKRFNKGRWLNDSGIYFCFRYLKYHLDVSNRIYFFNTFFYEDLNNLKAGQTINYEGVQKYTKHDDIFKYDYVAIPIKEEPDHWYLVLICNLPMLGDKPNSGSSKAQQDLLRPWKR
jgi:sentrin-specific protease 7